MCNVNISIQFMDGKCPELKIIHEDVSLINKFLHWTSYKNYSLSFISFELKPRKILPNVQNPRVVEWVGSGGEFKRALGENPNYINTSSSREEWTMMMMR